jgi:hypothetical protein
MGVFCIKLANFFDITLGFLSVYINAPVAQWIEHLASDQGVAGSTPAGCTKNKIMAG